MKLNECPMLWTLALVWLMKMCAYGMGLQISLIYKLNDFPSVWFDFFDIKNIYKWNDSNNQDIGLIQLGLCGLGL